MPTYSSQGADRNPDTFDVELRKVIAAIGIVPKSIRTELQNKNEQQLFDYIRSKCKPYSVTWNNGEMTITADGSHPTFIIKDLVDLGDMNVEFDRPPKKTRKQCYSVYCFLM